MSKLPKNEQNKCFSLLTDAAPQLQEALQKLLASSDYALRQQANLQELLNSDNCITTHGYEAYASMFTTLSLLDFEAYSKNLRQVRQRVFLRLLLRQYASFATVSETMSSWSDFADAAILFSLKKCQEITCQRYGHPQNERGEVVELYTIAMGKLGGQELNFSSDVDLIMVYSEDGFSTGPERISNHQYFIKVVQSFLQLFQQNTADGFVFRVDLRLRPNGESGPLVASLTSLETYYQEQGRDWERYAMVKARLIGEELPNNPWFQRIITPFVYRRYVDFTVIESLRSMKALIEREIQINPRLNDIKRGLGGIREVEFIVQNIQLIRGGRMPQLRQVNALKTVDILVQEGLLSQGLVLKKAYLFLRELENCLQALNDQQTHSLPEEASLQLKICCAMGFADWGSLCQRLQKFRRIIRLKFTGILNHNTSHWIYSDSERLLNQQLSNLWQGHFETTMSENLLATLHYNNPGRCFQLLHAFRLSPKCRRLSQTARWQLDRFMPMLLKELTAIENTEEVLLSIIQLLENILTRSAYVALLSENPQCLREVLLWFSTSPFVSQLLLNNPFLLEILLEPAENWSPPKPQQLKNKLNKILSHWSEQEEKEEVLRQFKLSNWLHIARAEKYKRLTAIQAAALLSDLAEIIVIAVAKIAVQQLAIKNKQIHQIKTNFAIIAYGKLGSRELNYDSDLDLVFIYSLPAEQSHLTTRLTQKILHMLTTRLRTGILYPVDTRLRPSGEAGLLVSSLSAFVHYQRHEAWVWEHQALIKSRIIWGGRLLKKEFHQMKKEIFTQKRDKEQILAEIKAMREKMIKHQENEGHQQLKKELLDLEFFVQYLVLTKPALTYDTNTLKLLKQLQRASAILPEEFNVFKKAYASCHEAMHQRLLSNHVEEFSHLTEKSTVFIKRYTDSNLKS